MLADYKPGQKIIDYFVVRHKELRSKKSNGGSYISLELGDASGRIFGSVWDNVSDTLKILIPGKLIKVQATVIEWHGLNHLSIDKIRTVHKDDDVSLELFVPHSCKSTTTLLQEYSEFVNQIDNKFLNKILTTILNDSPFVASLQKAPAGKLWHHCYLGGLLEHTINVTRVAQSIAQHYEHINHDLLLAGALLHDIGKIIEYNWDGFIDYSDAGRLHGHITIGYQLIARIVDDINGFPAALRNELLHLILSHQGKKEHGSPVQPMMREAFILSFADEVDSKLGAFDRIYRRENEPGKRWSSYVKLLDGFLYFGENEN